MSKALFKGDLVATIYSVNYSVIIVTLQLPIYSGPVKFDRGSEELQRYRFSFYKIPSRFPCFTADTCNQLQVREAFFILTIFRNI